MGNRDLERALKDYEEIYGRPTPIRYDVLKFSDEHRKLDALLRRYYDYLHPLVKDLFTSFALEFKIILEELEAIKMEKSQLIAEVQEKRQQLEDETDDRIVELKDEREKIQQELDEVTSKEDQYSDAIKSLKHEIKEKDALIITQRRQLDLLIEKTAKMEKANSEQQEKITKSIDQVSTFTSDIMKIEEDMRRLESTRLTLEEENQELKDELENKDNEVSTEIAEITKLYQTLKHEYEEVVNVLKSQKKENEQYKALVKDKDHEIKELSERLDILKKDVDTIGNKSEMSDLEAQNLQAEIEQLRKKNEVFSKIAHKLLDLRDKLESDQVQIVSKAKKPEEYAKDAGVSVKKWQPNKKSALEKELEKEIGFNHSLSLGAKELAAKPRNPLEFSRLKLERKEIPKEVLDKINMKLDKKSQDDPVINTIRNVEPQKSDFDKALSGEFSLDFPQFDLTGIEDEIDKIDPNQSSESPKLENSDQEVSQVNKKDEPASTEPQVSNFEKMLNYIENEDVDVLMEFANSLPSPPEKAPNISKEKKPESEDKRKNSRKMVSN